MGLFALTASTGAAISWAQLYWSTASAGSSCRCSWKLVLQASNTMVSCLVISSSTPWMCSSKRPPFCLRITSSSAA